MSSVQFLTASIVIYPCTRRVRATYTTFSSSIAPQFLDSLDENVPTDIFPPIYHTTSTSFTPFLTESELERIDSTFMQSRSWSKHMPPASVRATVLAQQPRPKPLHSTWLCGKSAPESCGFCGQTASTKMPQCAKYAYCLFTPNDRNPHPDLDAKLFDTATKSGKSLF